MTRVASLLVVAGLGTSTAYFRKSGLLGRLKAAAVDRLLGAIRDWDRRTASRVTHFIAISRTVQERIRECYGRDSVVIFPPVDTEFYTPARASRENPGSAGVPPAPERPGRPRSQEDFYLVVSALAPYKRFDLAVEA